MKRRGERYAKVCGGAEVNEYDNYMTVIRNHQCLCGFHGSSPVVPAFAGHGVRET